MFIIFAVTSLLVIGLLAFSGKLSKFGRLPGDIQYRGTRTRVFAPITSMLLLSLLLSLVLSLLTWIF
ncbi:MAG: DUF2905 domain-containing protein [Pyrinomonadaceae bacterium]|nr:DUF2905 domain-containing protein [Pyrinomonadaceae bacterium]